MVALHAGYEIGQRAPSRYFTVAAVRWK